MVKEFLNKGILINKLIVAKICEIDSLKKLRDTIGSSRFYEIVDGNKKNKKVDELNIKIVNYENEINIEIDRLIDVKREIKVFIENVEEEELLSILTLKYISFKTFEEIADILHYSERQIYRLHKKAILNLEKHKNKIPKIIKENSIYIINNYA